MKVVILCGGRGVRFSEATEHKPKPLVEIGGKPILWHIMKIYSHYGYSDFVLCLGYKGEMIKKYLLDYKLMSNDFTIELGKKDRIEFHGLSDETNWKVTLAETGLNAQTGARIKRIEKYIDSDLFMLTYGDAVANLDIERLVNFHRSHNGIGTITAVNPLSRFGQLEIGDKGKVNKFEEKGEIEGSCINGGFFVFDHRVFQYVNDNDDCAFEQESLKKLVSDGQLAAYFHNSYWQCMDTYRDWQILEQDWSRKNPPWKVW